MGMERERHSRNFSVPLPKGTELWLAARRGAQIVDEEIRKLDGSVATRVNWRVSREGSSQSGTSLASLSSDETRSLGSTNFVEVETRATLDRDPGDDADLSEQMRQDREFDEKFDYYGLTMANVGFSGGKEVRIMVSGPHEATVAGLASVIEDRLAAWARRGSDTVDVTPPEPSAPSLPGGTHPVLGETHRNRRQSRRGRLGLSSKTITEQIIAAVAAGLILLIVSLWLAHR